MARVLNIGHTSIDRPQRSEPPNARLAFLSLLNHHHSQSAAPLGQDPPLRLWQHSPVRVARNHNVLAFAGRRTTSGRFGRSSKPTPTGTYGIASAGSKSNRQRDCAQCRSRGQPGLPVPDLSARWGTTGHLPPSPQLLLLPPYGDDLERDCGNADVIQGEHPTGGKTGRFERLAAGLPGCTPWPAISEKLRGGVTRIHHLSRLPA